MAEKNSSMSKTPAPCSAMERFFKRFVVLTMASLIRAVFYTRFLDASSGKAERASATEAVMMEADTDVPDVTTQSP